MVLTGGSEHELWVLLWGRLQEASLCGLEFFQLKKPL